MANELPIDPLIIDEPGRRVLLMGNEAIARGAIEAGVDYCSAYPGSPSSEIVGALARVAPYVGFYAEWSANEKVALEGACGAAFAGLRAMSSMKQNGVNVCSDLITAMTLTGSPGGLVLVVCDDPGGISSTNEVDTRNYARLADMPLLEPGSLQDAKDMVKWAFELSEQLELICMVRSVTRISHARGVIELGPIAKSPRTPRLAPHQRYASLPPCPQHKLLKEKLFKAKAIFETSVFNCYEGPPSPSLVIVTSGTGWQYSREAIDLLELGDRVGIIKLGTTWPLPEQFILEHLRGVTSVVVIEESDPFLECNLKEILYDYSHDLPAQIKIYGKRSGHVQGPWGPGVGEMDPDVVLHTLCRILDIGTSRRGVAVASTLSYTETPHGIPLPRREVAFCPGCPHRASYWVMNNAVKLDGRDGLVIGDIGCYSLGFGRTGYYLSRTMHCMGSAIGFCSGMGKLGHCGFTQPLIAVVGDSTFFHACLPGLVNARYNSSHFVCVVLDNSATAMTGFQPHPGTGQDAFGKEAPKLSIERICQALDIPDHVVDPFEVSHAIDLLCRLLTQEELQVIIFRHTCAVLHTRQHGLPHRRVYVDAQRCLGEQCGCNRFCSSAFGCPAITWDALQGHACIDDVICARCGLCASLCPQHAIVIEEKDSPCLSSQKTP